MCQCSRDDLIGHGVNFALEIDSLIFHFQPFHCYRVLRSFNAVLCVLADTGNFILYR